MKKIISNSLKIIYPVAVYFVISFGILLMINGLNIKVKQEDIIRILLTEQVFSAAAVIWIYQFQTRAATLKKYHYHLSDFGFQNIILIMLSTYLLLNTAALIILVFRLNELFPEYSELQGIISSGPFLLQFVATVFMAPIIEEVLCRGIIFNRMREISGFWSSALVSSLIWAVMHLNVVQGITTFLFGIFLAFLYEKFKMLIVPILSHGFFNLIGQVAAFTSKLPGNAAEEVIADRTLFIPALVIDTAILLWLIFLLYHSKFPREPRARA